MGLIINPRQIIKDGITSLRDVWSSSKVSTELSGKQATLVSGTNIKTINGNSLLGSGDITISGGGGDIPRIDMTATTATLDPNKFYVWGEVASLDISLAAETAGIENIYKFQFQSGVTATTLTLPNNVKWNKNEVPNILLNTTYIVTIISNIATIDRCYSAALLPDEYQQVEYLKSSGTQYIDTGVESNGQYTMTVDMQADINTRWAFGCRNTFNSNAFMMGVFADNNQYTDIFCGYANTSTTANDGWPNDGNRHRLTIDKGSFFCDTTLIHSFNTSNFGGPNIALFAVKSNVEGIFGLGPHSIYQVTITNQGTTLADIYPCYRKSDNVAGMYDIVRDIFLTNAGTGSFIVGPDV